MDEQSVLCDCGELVDAKGLKLLSAVRCPKCGSNFFVSPVRLDGAKRKGKRSDEAKPRGFWLPETEWTTDHSISDLEVALSQDEFELNFQKQQQLWIVLLSFQNSIASGCDEFADSVSRFLACGRWKEIECDTGIANNLHPVLQELINAVDLSQVRLARSHEEFIQLNASQIMAMLTFLIEASPRCALASLMPQCCAEESQNGLESLQLELPRVVILCFRYDGQEIALAIRERLLSEGFKTLLINLTCFLNPERLMERINSVRTVFLILPDIWPFTRYPQIDELTYRILRDRKTLVPVSIHESKPKHGPEQILQRFGEHQSIVYAPDDPDAFLQQVVRFATQDLSVLERIYKYWIYAAILCMFAPLFLSIRLDWLNALDDVSKDRHALEELRNEVAAQNREIRDLRSKLQNRQ